MSRLGVALTPATILEQWLMKMQSALAQRTLVHVQAVSDGAIIAITKYGAGWSSFLAGRELQGDIGNILAHADAACRDGAQRPLVDLRAELQTAVEDVQDAAAGMRDLAGVLRAELYGGRSRLTDCLALARRPDSIAMAHALEKLDTLLERVDAIQAFPQELDALMKGAADVPKRH